MIFFYLEIQSKSKIKKKEDFFCGGGDNGGWRGREGSRWVAGVGGWSK